MDNREDFFNINECNNCGLYVTSEELYLNSCFYCELEATKEAAEHFDFCVLSNEDEFRENEEWFRC